MKSMEKIILCFVLSYFYLCPTSSLGYPEQVQDQTASTQTEKNKPSGTRSVSKRHPGRALLESGALITGSTIDYWRTYADFQEDWQFKFTWKDQKRRFFTAESPKFDSNAFWFNWSHAASGAAYYNLARTNGLNSRASFLFSFGLSALWEIVCEWREIISTNDMIFTSFGGPAIGEPLFQVASYFSHRNGILNHLASLLFDPFLPPNNWFDRKKGFAWNSNPDTSWHNFIVFLGLRKCSASPTGQTAIAESESHYGQFDIGLDMETNTVPGYSQVESFHRFLWNTLSSRVFLDFNFSPAGLEEFNIRTKAVLFGYTWQSIHQDENGSPYGSSGSVGFGTAFEVFRKRPVAWYDSSAEFEGQGPALSDARFNRPTPTRYTDKIAVISPLGSVLELSRFGRQLKARWTFEAYGSFALVNALAYNRYSENHDPSGVKSTLLNWGYYYAAGMTLASNLAADWRQWHLCGAFSYEFYDSIQGQDRYQFLGVVTDDFKIHDSRLVWRLKLGYRLPATPFELAIASENIGRTGRLLDLNEHYHERRVFYQLRLVF